MGRQGEKRGETGLGGNQAEKTWGDVEPFYTVDGYCAPIKLELVVFTAQPVCCAF